MPSGSGARFDALNAVMTAVSLTAFGFKTSMLMNLKNLLHLSPNRNDGKKVRYAVVGAGWIAQEDFMPGVAHTGNSVLSAIISGDAEKADLLAIKYGLEHVYSYDRFDEALRSGNFEAIYLAVPNSQHRDFAVRALDAGIHVLLEKPMAPTVDDCLAIIAASERSGAKLMIAYRLHFDEATLQAIDTIQSGKIGEPRIFSSVFGQQVSALNSRTEAAHWAGPLPDMGPYPINAARMFFNAEPTEAFAQAASLPQARFAEVEEMISVILRFPGERLAQFVVSYGTNPVNECRVIGANGDLRLSPAYAYDIPIEQWLTIGEKTEHTKFNQRDQFGGETKYFSDCILDNKHPEPDGNEGLADVRVIKAIEKSFRTSQPVPIQGGGVHASPGKEQVMKLPAVSPGELIHAAPPEK